MSGPIEEPDRQCEDEALPGLELREGRQTEVGGLPVTRVLPTKGRRTVGAWCFVDMMGPADAEEPDPMEVGPHPHIGLSTVTWLLDGEALHTDSLGSEQVIRPGQLNLMTAGHGIAHAELAARPPFRGVQMWVAQPEATRHGDNAFAHHAELPRTEIRGAEALVMIGTFADATSDARADTAMVGAQVDLHGSRAALPVAPTFEHAVVPLDGTVRVGWSRAGSRRLRRVGSRTVDGRPSNAAAWRRAARRADPHVVELRVRFARGHRAGLARLAGPRRRPLWPRRVVAATDRRPATTVAAGSLSRLSLRA